MILWDSRWLIAAITFALILLAGIYSFFIAEPVYETSSEIYTPDYHLINGTGLSNGEYLSFLRKPELEQKLIDKYGLDISIEAMGRKLTVDSERDGNNVNNNITLTISDTDKELAVNLLNDWVALFDQEVETYINNINDNYLKKVEDLMNSRDNTYLAAEKALTAFEKNSILDISKMKLSSKTSRQVEYENRVVNLKNDIKLLEEKNNVLQKQFERTDKILVTKQTLDDSSMKALADTLQGYDLENLTVSRESINDIYMTIQRQLNQVELDLSNKREEMKLLNDDINILKKEIDSLKTVIASLGEEKDRLNLRVAEAKKNYTSSENTYSSLLQEERRHVYNISIVRRAVTPENPISPRKKMNVMIAAVLGIFIGVFFVFARHYFTEESDNERKKRGVTG